MYSAIHFSLTFVVYFCMQINLPGRLCHKMISFHACLRMKVPDFSLRSFNFLQEQYRISLLAKNATLLSVQITYVEVAFILASHHVWHLLYLYYFSVFSTQIHLFSYNKGMSVQCFSTGNVRLSYEKNGHQILWYDQGTLSEFVKRKTRENIEPANLAPVCKRKTTTTACVVFAFVLNHLSRSQTPSRISNECCNVSISLISSFVP